MGICHEHNSRAAPPAERPYGIRVSLPPGDPFAKLVGADWEMLHWFATERERDHALTDMASRHPYSRRGDEPALVFERVGRAGGEQAA